ncbi:flavin reductase family protein [Chitinophaga silvatica]|uniref:Flavin reductase family protein n=1 Tax=Chitinophaga silvatica TaxID=2282649 RepID=A0A3E1YG57_9BACT|nr:flavin reductase family protein [Chitinophaga silvatica]RFS26381.1 flavin reductase family protein [Chitinophaga silvatica]
MRRNYKKADLPVYQIRKYLEPGPVVLISTLWEGKTNIMTQSWHTIMEFTPSLIGCMITAANHSFEMIRESRECVINIPTVDLINEIIGIGNITGDQTDKFKKFALTPEKGQFVKTPLIKECYANYECKLIDDSLLEKYNFFIFEVLRAQAATYPRYPKTVHYRGAGRFMVSGKELSLPQKFKKKNLL